MKFSVKDHNGKIFDVEAPEGYTLEKVAQYASEKLGFKVKGVEHLDDTEERVRQAKEHGKSESQSEIAGNRGRIAELEAELSALREELREDRRNAAHELAEERAKHEETRKLRVKAIGNAEVSVRESLMRALDNERSAREAAEKRATAATPVIVENKFPETKRGAWRMSVVSRDAHGFAKDVDILPK